MSLNERDWIHSALQFIAGSLVGGASVWACFGSYPSSWKFILAAALLVGTLAAIFGDRFWYAIKDIWPC